MVGSRAWNTELCMQSVSRRAFHAERFMQSVARSRPALKRSSWYALGHGLNKPFRQRDNLGWGYQMTMFS